MSPILRAVVLFFFFSFIQIARNTVNVSSRTIKAVDCLTILTQLTPNRENKKGTDKQQKKKENNN